MDFFSPTITRWSCQPPKLFKTLVGSNFRLTNFPTSYLLGLLRAPADFLLRSFQAPFWTIFSSVMKNSYSRDEPVIFLRFLHFSSMNLLLEVALNFFNYWSMTTLRKNLIIAWMEAFRYTKSELQVNWSMLAICKTICNGLVNFNSRLCCLFVGLVYHIKHQNKKKYFLSVENLFCFLNLESTQHHNTHRKDAFLF